MNKAILLEAEDWEGLFINGKLIQEGHTLNEDTSRIKYFIELSKKYSFNLDELKELCVTEEDEETLMDCGNFPQDINELSGNYGNEIDE